MAGAELWKNSRAKSERGCGETGDTSPAGYCGELYLSVRETMLHGFEKNSGTICLTFEQDHLAAMLRISWGGVSGIGDKAEAGRPGRKLLQ